MTKVKVSQFARPSLTEASASSNDLSSLERLKLGIKYSLRKVAHGNNRDPNREGTFSAGRELDTPWPGSDLRNFQNLMVRSRPGK